MKLKKQKKIFGSIGVILILVPLLFFGQPQKAKAVVPVFDSVNASINAKHAGLTGSLVQKEFVLDNIVWIFVKAIIKNMITSVTDWVRNGFQGNPLFVTDVKRFLRDAGIEASGVFMEEYLDPDVYDLLCEPWRFQVGIGLELYRKSRDFPECTVLDIINNVQGMRDFMADFRNGGWQAWFSLFEQPSNNPYGAYAENLFAMEAKIQDSRNNAIVEAIMNQGFLGVKECISCMEYDSNSGECAICAEWEIHSPGKWVEGQINAYTTSELRNLEIADEINELISALLGQLWNWMIGGLSGELSSGYTPPSYVPAGNLPNYPEGFVPGEIPDNPIDIDISTLPGTATVSLEIKRAIDFDLFTAFFPSEPATIYYTLDGSEPNASSTKYMKAHRIGDGMTVKWFAVTPSGEKTSNRQAFVYSGTTKENMTPPVANATSSFVTIGGEKFVELNPFSSIDFDDTDQIAMYEWDFDTIYEHDSVKTYDWWTADYDRNGSFEETQCKNENSICESLDVQWENSALGVVRVKYSNDAGDLYRTLRLRVTDNEGLYHEQYFQLGLTSGRLIKAWPPVDSR